MRSFSSVGRDRIEIGDMHPFVAADIRRRIDAFAFDELVKFLGVHFIDIPPAMRIGRR